jgi:uncharacterized protein YndB with AHSA1/START domain
MSKPAKYDWSQFKMKIEIDRPVSVVFEAWTNGDEIAKWFTEEAIIEPRRNGRIYMMWLTGETMDDKIISIAKNRLFTIPFGDKRERVTVRFKKDGRGCICELHQYNMGTSPKDKWEWHKGCAMGWTFFLANLKAYLEHGIDLRNHNPKRSYKKGFINS